MREAAARPSETVRTRMLLLPAVLLTLGSVAGCASSPAHTHVQWAPGTYEFQATHPEAGPVRGLIEVTTSGPVEVTTDVLGSCLAPDPLLPGYRDRVFQCASDYSVHVRRGQRGQDPVVGQISNQRTEIQTRQVRSTCAYYSTSPEGRDVCVQWSYRTVEERVTTGSAETFRVVSTFRD